MTLRQADAHSCAFHHPVMLAVVLVSQVVSPARAGGRGLRGPLVERRHFDDSNASRMPVFLLGRIGGAPSSRRPKCQQDAGVPNLIDKLAVQIQT